MSALRAPLESGLGLLLPGLPSDRVDRLLAYLDLLGRWNRVYNLTAIRDPQLWVSHHLLDSLSPITYLQDGSLVDVGSGGGFPGLPIAIVQPQRPVTLIETSQKKSAFLAHAVGTLGLVNATVVPGRVETVEGGGFRNVISRAFSDLADFVRLAGHLLAPGGRMLAMKGAWPAEELEAVGPGWQHQIHALQVPGLDARRHVVLLEVAA